MAKYIGKVMSVSTFKIKQCKLAPTVTVLCTHNFACTKFRWTKILNLSSPAFGINFRCNLLVDWHQ